MAKMPDARGAVKRRAFQSMAGGLTFACMCGRYTLVESASEVYEALGVRPPAGHVPRYNIAPTQPVPAIAWQDGARQARALRWGLVPSWAKDASIGARMINARAETIAQKPAFRAAFRHRRCVLPADGFYEWRVEGGRKLPFRIRRSDRAAFLLAGIRESWQAPGQEPVESVAIVTVPANPDIAQLHDRMPAILNMRDADAWLDPTTELSQAADLLAPWAGEALVVDAVSTYVNSPRNDGPECIAVL
jgi:putative SOS response-associated peptidase YedK